MEIKKTIDEALSAIGNLNISTDNLILALKKLLELTHKNGLDKEAIEALAQCGIKLVIEEV